MQTQRGDCRRLGVEGRYYPHSETRPPSHAGNGAKGAAQLLVRVDVANAEAVADVLT